MKQRITVEQLNELTEEQKTKLREWWIPQDGDFFARRRYHVPDDSPMDECFIGGLEFADSGGVDTFQAKDSDIPLLSIGQMIELLDNEDSLEIIKYSSDTWCVVVPDLDDSWSEVVCDALWKTVKYTLGGIIDEEE